MLLNGVIAGTAIIMSCDIYVAVISLVATQCVCVSLSLPSVSIFLTQMANGTKGLLRIMCQYFRYLWSLLTYFIGRIASVLSIIISK